MFDFLRWKDFERLWLCSIWHLTIFSFYVIEDFDNHPRKKNIFVQIELRVVFAEMFKDKCQSLHVFRSRRPKDENVINVKETKFASETDETFLAWLCEMGGASS